MTSKRTFKSEGVNEDADSGGITRQELKAVEQHPDPRSHSVHEGEVEWEEPDEELGHEVEDLGCNAIHLRRQPDEVTSVTSSEIFLP